MQLHQVKAYLASILLFSCFSYVAQAVTDGLGLWDTPAPSIIIHENTQQAWVRPALGTTLELDYNSMKSLLVGAPDEYSPGAALVSLPVGTNQFMTFNMRQVQTMEPELAAIYPEIRTFAGQAEKNNRITARVDYGPNGFHAMIRTGEDLLFVDPYSADNTSLYSIYSRSDFYADPDTPLPETCAFDITTAAIGSGSGSGAGAPPPSGARITTGDAIRSYRLAMAADSTFIAFYGGRNAAVNGIITGVNRVNDMFERDAGVRLLLIGNLDDIIIEENNPFDNDFIEDITETINSLINPGSYDVGHLVYAMNVGGLAGLGVVCDTDFKGAGYTGLPSPRNDPFWIDYVTHELGHQFDATHTFNGAQGACFFNRTGQTAYEPGSGTTIMGYAGICAGDDVQPASDALFHSGSIQQIFDFVSQVASCGTERNSQNDPPVANGGPDYTIPVSTPFTLSGSATDPNGDRLTFSWEQFDLGDQQPLSAPDDGEGPLFRCFLPSASPARTFPEWDDILAGGVDPTERLPTQGRSMKFNFVVRDNDPGSGAVDVDEVVLTVDGDAGPFEINAPAAAETVLGLYTCKWDVAGTDDADFDAGLVDIFLSLDDGQSFQFPVTLSTTNDGEEIITFPNANIPDARLLIQPVSNVFFAVSDTFTVDAGGPGASVIFVTDPPNVVDDTSVFSNGNGNNILDPGERNVMLTLPIKNIGAGFSQNIIGRIAADTPGVIVDVDTVNYPNIGPGGTVVNLLKFEISVPGSHPCGVPVRLLMDVQSDQGGNLVFIEVPTGDNGVCEEIDAVVDLVIEDFYDTPSVMLVTNTVTYTLRVRNDGVDITDNAYVGFGIQHLMYVQSSSSACPPYGLTSGCRVGGLAPGASKDLEFTVVVNPTVTGSVQVSGFVFDDGDVVGFFDDHEFETTLIADVNTNGIPDFAERDVDDDGLPSTWELRYFGDIQSADPTDDSDWDGFFNGEEYIAGTHPNNPDSHLWVEAHLLTPSGGYIISWPAVDGREYAVYGAAEPGGEWTLIEEGIAAAVPWNEYQIPAAATSYRVYCVGVKKLGE